jgi:RNAse (barnase) inhibitor barstar
VTTPPKDPLSALPSHCVRPLAPFTADALARWAGETRQRYVEIDLAGSGSKKAVLQAIGRALDFPNWYGANLDALYDSLTDLTERSDIVAWLIVLRHLPSVPVLDDEQRAALLDVFSDATEAFADAGIGLRVFYSP